MQRDDRVFRISDPTSPGTVVDVRTEGGWVFCRVRWDKDLLGYHPWYSQRQLSVIAHARA